MQKTMDRFLNPCELILFIVMLGLSLPILFASEEISSDVSSFVLDEENIQDLETLSNKIHFKPHHHRHHHHCSSSCPTTTCCQNEKEQARLTSSRKLIINNLGSPPPVILNFALTNVQGSALAISIDPSINVGTIELTPNASGDANGSFTIPFPIIGLPYILGLIALEPLTPFTATSNSFATITVEQGGNILSASITPITSTSSAIGETLPTPLLNVIFTSE